MLICSVKYLNVESGIFWVFFCVKINSQSQFLTICLFTSQVVQVQPQGSYCWYWEPVGIIPAIAGSSGCCISFSQFCVCWRWLWQLQIIMKLIRHAHHSCLTNTQVLRASYTHTRARDFITHYSSRSFALYRLTLLHLRYSSYIYFYQIKISLANCLHMFLLSRGILKND